VVLSPLSSRDAGAAPPDRCDGQVVTMPGTDGPDRIEGTPRRDVIHAGDGSDVVDGMGGGDLICGGAGDDRLAGGASFDALLGEAGRDVLQGGAADDALLGGSDDDPRLDGGAGYDVAYGGDGADVCVADERVYVCERVQAGRDVRLPTEPPRAIPCDYLASPRGDDGDPGSVSRPFRTAERLVNTLKAGETGCLEPGAVFEEPDQEVYVRARGRPGRPITLRTRPGGPTATIRGRIWVCKDAREVKCSPRVEGAHDVVFTDLRLDGRNELRRRRGLLAGVAGLPSPTVDGDNVTFDRVDVTTFSTGPCFALGSLAGYGTALGTEIRRSRIHDCGRKAFVLANDMLDQALSLEATRGTWIHDNLIHDNADNGIYVYGDVRNALIEHNVIDRNGRGLRFDFGETSEGRRRNPEGVRVRRNVISNSLLNYREPEHWQVEGQAHGGPRPWANRVQSNCLYHPRDRNFEPRSGSPAFVGGDATNVIATRGPGFVDRRSFRLRGGRGFCPRSFGPRPTDEGDIPGPRFGRTVNLTPRSPRRPQVRRAGTRAARRFLPVIAPAAIPIERSVVDTTRSEAQLRFATGGRAVGRAVVSGGAFSIRQDRAGEPVTELRLTGDYVQPAGRAAQDEPRSYRRLRKVLWKGRCRSCRVSGKWASGSRFRSTFSIEDRRDGTFVAVREGQITVRDCVTGRSLVVRAGGSYLARRGARTC
jgi:hypothetical protein